MPRKKPPRRVIDACRLYAAIVIAASTFSIGVFLWYYVLRGAAEDVWMIIMARAEGLAQLISAGLTVVGGISVVACSCAELDPPRSLRVFALVSLLLCVADVLLLPAIAVAR
jgi:hypothetical protein